MQKNIFYIENNPLSLGINDLVLTFEDMVLKEGENFESGALVTTRKVPSLMLEELKKKIKQSLNIVLNPNNLAQFHLERNKENIYLKNNPVVTLSNGNELVSSDIYKAIVKDVMKTFGITKPIDWESAVDYHDYYMKDVSRKNEYLEERKIQRDIIVKTHLLSEIKRRINYISSEEVDFNLEEIRRIFKEIEELKAKINPEVSKENVFLYNGEEVGQTLRYSNGVIEKVTEIKLDDLCVYLNYKSLEEEEWIKEEFPLVDESKKAIGNKYISKYKNKNTLEEKAEIFEELNKNNKRYVRKTIIDSNRDIEREKIELLITDNNGLKEEIEVFKDSFNNRNYLRKVNGVVKVRVSSNMEGTEIIEYNDVGKIISTFKYDSDNKPIIKYLNYDVLPNDFIEEKVSEELPKFSVYDDILNKVSVNKISEKESQDFDFSIFKEVLLNYKSVKGKKNRILGKISSFSNGSNIKDIISKIFDISSLAGIISLSSKKVNDFIKIEEKEEIDNEL